MTTITPVAPAAAKYTDSYLTSMIESFAIVFCSEIADRTFILVVLYSIKLSWIPLIVTAFLSMAVMNFLAIGVGYLLPLVVMRGVLDWIAFIIFLAFGILSLYEGVNMESKTVYEEFKEEYNSRDENEQNETKHMLWVCLEFFGLLMVNELGDKSEISTIAITALYNVFGVVCGTLIAYFLAILIAATLGHVVSKWITEKQMTIIGGFIFILFALQILFDKIGFI